MDAEGIKVRYLTNSGNSNADPHDGSMELKYRWAASATTAISKVREARPLHMPSFSSALLLHRKSRYLSSLEISRCSPPQP
jgi:hypothetical protein